MLSYSWGMTSNKPGCEARHLRLYRLSRHPLYSSIATSVGEVARSGDLATTWSGIASTPGNYSRPVPKRRAGSCSPCEFEPKALPRWLPCLSPLADWWGPLWRDEKSVLNKLRFHPDFVAPFSPPLRSGFSFSPPCEGGAILIGTIDAMSIYETPSGRLSSDAPLFRRPGNRKRPPASMNLPGGAQQRTAQTTGAKQSRARSLVVFQFLDVGLQFLPSGPAAEVELKHLQGPLGRLLACPKADQQAGDDSQVDLDLHAVLVGCQQMAAAQNALEPAKKEFY